ncbi:putative ABC transporter B family member 8 isoform X1 [Miscanthus floridulus]|uniref:putative ABC transporter B family member 8 isoform X1 n=1 Tax=Miscanthus floridulus TaxID=154761 RepID=UPI003459FED7
MSGPAPAGAGAGGERPMSIRGMFRFADRVDVLLMALGTLGAIGDGCSTNLLLIFASDVMNALGYGGAQASDGGGGAKSAQFMHEVEKSCLNFVYLAFVVLAVAFMEGYCWSRTSERQVLRIRYLYLQAILRQEAGFFDSQEATTSEIINSISKDASHIQEVLSEKVPLFLMHSTVFVSGLVFATYFCWRLALVSFPLVLLLIIPGLIYGKYLLYLSRQSRHEYAKANSLVEQALGSIKTVYSFTAEKRIIQRYTAILDKTIKLGIKQGIAKGLAVGFTGLSFAIWAFLAWYGGRLVMFHHVSGGRIYAAGISFVLGGLSLGMALPELKHFTEASVAATRILDRINRVPQINADDPKGLILDQIRGELEFESVCFVYPSRPNMPVLKNFNLQIPAGQTIALVGSSGSGKSTAIALVQRFYDASEGTVKIDGFDIKELQLKWIRSKMGLVSQDHALFGTSIKENILFGKPEATMDEVYAAAMTANAHNFIRGLPEEYETKIGERGALLSGGQKQRIAIARAIIKNPAVLLLDEATSALDSESEKLVQHALDQASMGRTTLVVAHKLSTVKNADQIAVVDGGTIAEIGTHDELISKGGPYSRLVKLQKMVSYIDQENEQFRASSVARTSTSRHSMSRASPMPLTPAILTENNSDVPPPAPSFSRLLAMNAPEWKQAVVGSLSALVYGSLQPIYAITIGGMIAAFFVQDQNEMNAIIRRYALIFCSLSLVSIVVNLLQHYNFAYMGEHLVRRIRVQVLEKILTFEAAWFDEETNSSGALCSRLSNEASLVKTLVADRISLLLQTASGIIIAVTMGLMVAWKLSLVMIAVQPSTMICYYAKKMVLSNVSRDLAKAQHQSTQIAIEAVYNHRMVTSFGCSSKVLQLFEHAQEEPLKKARKKSWVAGITTGLSPCLSFLSWALDFWYGGKLAQSGEISAGDVFKTFFVLVSTGKLIADAGSMTSDLAKGANAVASVFEVLDRKSISPKNSQEEKEDQKKKIEGRIEFKKVDFAYPTRPECLILQDFSLDVKAGTSVGLVGRSGCGKSTIIGLIQRFYDVDRGSVRIDGMDVREMNILWFRGFTALVSQEPAMFSGSVRDNIAFGKPEADEDEIVEAAKAANAHEFISSLKDGYDTDCGEHGIQLSGGQKQRIAIARAIIRNPEILLLDEATSALDAQSEQVVQEALDRILSGRTTIVVAHRLNTIKNVDSIAFLGEGKVVERGSYPQLMSKKGAFYNLATLQK